jgi:hypothetical protein
MIFSLNEHAIEIEGVVVFANVPGNLQRPNLPLGMGVRFDAMPDSVRRVIAAFIQQRMDSLEV